MKKTYVLFCFTTIFTVNVSAQQYGLFHTNTLFDAFENPAQRAFVLDYSRQFASNFFLPNLGLNGGNKGDVNYAIKTRLNEGEIDTEQIPAGNNTRNKFYGNANVYLLTFRSYLSWRDNKEIGFSWQVRADGDADYTNETAIAAKTFGRLNTSQDGLFNGDGYAQTYHQFSLSYRQDETDELAFGGKLSLLSGITYNSGRVDESSLTVNPRSSSVALQGVYKGSFLKKDDIDKKMLIPDFKNPGLSLSFGSSYRDAASGIFLMGNLKDLGFIRWNKNSSTAVINDVITLNRNPGANDLARRVSALVSNKAVQGSFYTPTNAKADFLISKTYGLYTPGFIVSKNLFYNGGDVVLVNTFKMNEFSLAFVPAYNMNKIVLFGAQGIYQTPNFECFMGTDNLFKSSTLLKSTSYSSTGTIGASFYMGLNIKFGYVVEHPLNSSYIPVY
ncbi:hypothetical protein SAMN06265348_103216 [Pedobacter westerhofensis]|uniref:DUF5723 domain-containing protein n=1 Tax=Pedobacter westerhofensis TaxID=425512 RepID=A0A521C6X7_9SPHI|nr:DUF5723 family protein [Pedobacter westerhofensis]SMO54440.1 hypothetical protein SAMN06265348_103216 [Pedobacter westerhofensis]